MQYLFDNLFSNKYGQLESYIILIIAIACIGIVYVPKSWKIVRHYITLIHEFGHAFTGFIFGGKLKGIRLHSDTSGLTTSLLQVRFIPQFATTSAGYISPAVAGLLGAYLYNINMHGYIMLILLLLGLTVLLFIRNWFGLLPVLSLLALVYFALNTSLIFVSSISLVFIFVSIFGSIKAALELAMHHRNNPILESDASAMRQLTKIPTSFWVFYFVSTTIVLGLLSLYLLFFN